MQNNVAPPLVDSVTAWSQYLQELKDETDNYKRKQLSKKITDYYQNKQLQYLKDELGKIYTDSASYAAKRKFTANFTKQITDAVSQAYDAIIKRSFGKRKSKAAMQMINTFLMHSLDQKMEELNKWLFLERTVLVHSRWSSKKNRIVYQVYHQYQFDVVYSTNEEGDKNLVSVILSDYGKAFDETRFYIYTENNTYRFLGANILEGINHNMGILPFVTVHDGDPGFEDYLEPNIHLADGNLELNIGLSNLLDVVQKQTHAILTLTIPPDEVMPGVEDNSEGARSLESDRRLDVHDNSKLPVLYHGPNGEVPELKYVSPSADFDGAIQSLKLCLAALAQSYGAEGTIRIDATMTQSPATNFVLREKHRNKIIQRYRTILTEAEREILSLASELAAQYVAGMPVIDKEELKIEFTDNAMVQSLTPEQLLNAWKQGGIDHAEYIRYLYSNYSREEALAFIEEMFPQQEEGTIIQQDIKEEEPSE